MPLQKERMKVSYIDDASTAKAAKLLEKKAAAVEKTQKTATIKESNVKARPELLSAEKTIEKAKQFAAAPEYKKVNSFQELRAVTNSKLGYDGLPKVVSADSFENIAAGKTRLYRGVKASVDKTAKEIAEEFKRGSLWTGNSGGAVYGNGVYFTETKDLALKDYAGNGGALIEMVLDGTSRIADYKTIYQEFLNTGIPKNFGQKEDYELILGDVGQYAAIKGYDAIALNGFQDKDYWVLLNRTKAIVKE